MVSYGFLWFLMVSYWFLIGFVFLIGFLWYFAAQTPKEEEQKPVSSQKGDLCNWKGTPRVSGRTWAWPSPTRRHPARTTGFQRGQNGLPKYDGFCHKVMFIQY